jgi:hypothetical protein
MVFFALFILFSGAIPAISQGPFYYGSGGYERYDRVHVNDLNLINWATKIISYEPGSKPKSDDEGKYGNPENALGKASGNEYDIVSLGRGGSITLAFEYPIKNGEEWDFAVFENAFNDKFLELAYVEVSSDGNTFVRFNSCSRTPSPVSGFGTIDYTNITGLAGKYEKGYGTPFDLLDLVRKPEVYTGMVNINRISYVRIIDIIGDGTYYDDRTDAMKSRWGENNPIFDPYPTFEESAGFDLDGVGVRYQNTDPEGSGNPPNPPMLLSPENEEDGVSIIPTFTTKPFSDPDQDSHIQTRWQISIDKDFSDPNLLLDVTSPIFLTSLSLEVPFLDIESKYYWRAKFYDTRTNTRTDPNSHETSIDPNSEESTWSEENSFITITINTIITTDYFIDKNLNGIPDDQEFREEDPVDPNTYPNNTPTHTDPNTYPVTDPNTDLNTDGIPDINQMNNQFKCLNTIVGDGKSGIETYGKAEILFFKSIDPNSIPEPNSIEYKLAKPDKLPLGLFGFRLKTELGSDPFITIYLSEQMSNEANWFIYNLEDGWSRYSKNAFFSYNRDQLIILLKDGGPADMDGIQNGYIISIGGIGYFNKETPPPDQEAGFGGMGGCFIAACL